MPKSIQGRRNDNKWHKKKIQRLDEIEEYRLSTLPKLYTIVGLGPSARA